MNFGFDEKAEKLRKEIREFAKQELPSGYYGSRLEEEHLDEDWEFAMSISKKLSRKGWLTMNWPEEYGGMNATHLERLVYSEECGYWGIPGTGMGISGVAWVGPSLIMFGTEEQRKKYMPPIAAGEADGVWCTGYSEPDAGSDFANIRTRAERKGDEYIINGQKVWTSCAHRARWCWLAVRTIQNPEKKHNGISVIIVDMKSKGVTVKPILNYIGLHLFNEVFFDDVKVPVENLVGEENKGWQQLMKSLMYERGSVATGIYGTYMRIFDAMINYVKETGLIEKSEVRQKLADVIVDIETLKMLTYETVWKLNQGILPIYEPSRDKALNDMILEKLSIIGTEIIGPFSQLDPMDKDNKWAKLKNIIQQLFWMFPGMSIAAGTTDTQRNIVGQFGLQLPRSY